MTLEYSKLISDIIKTPHASVYDRCIELVSDSADARELNSLLAVIDKKIRRVTNLSSRAVLCLLAAEALLRKYNAKEAEPYVDRALEVLENNPDLLPYAYRLLVDICMLDGNLAKAELYTKKALGMVGKRLDRLFLALINNMAIIHQDYKRYHLSIEYFNQYKKYAAELGIMDGVIAATTNLATVNGQLGRFSEEEALLLESLTLSKKHGKKWKYVLIVANLVNHYYRIGDLDRALEYSRIALKESVMLKDPMLEAASRLFLAEVHLGRGDVDKASREAAAGLDICEENRIAEQMPFAYYVSGKVQRRLKNKKALFSLSKSVSLFESQWPNSYSEGIEFAYFEYGALLAEAGDGKGAEFLRKALDILQQKPMTVEIKTAILEAERLLMKMSEPGSMQQYEKMEITHENLDRLFDITKAIGLEENLSDALEKALEIAVEISGAERGVLWTISDAGVEPAVWQNYSDHVTREPDYGKLRQVALDVARTGVEKEKIADAGENLKGKKTTSAFGFFKSYLTLPFGIHEKKTGVVYLESRFIAHSFSAQVKKLLYSVLEQAAIIIDKLERLERESIRSRKLETEIWNKDRELKETLKILEKQKEESKERYGFHKIIGNNTEFVNLIGKAKLAAKTDLPVLITGESGTGKELFARALHYNGARRNGPFVSANSAAIPENLLEAELFGSEKGAYTGATDTKKGLFELASGGTLFLDEIGDMSIAMQARLLRVLQENEIRRIGGEDIIRVDVRLVTASNKDLNRLVQDNMFREDLLFRINTISLKVPPVRERKDDIPLILRYLWEKAGGDIGRTAPSARSEFISILEKYDWPGNIRELEHEIEKIIALGDGTMNPEFISEHIRNYSPAMRSKLVSTGDDLNFYELEKRLIESAYLTSHGVKSKAARLLGIPRSSFCNKLAKYDIKSI